MEPNNSPQDIVPHRSASGVPQRPINQRRVFSDFTTRPVNPARIPMRPAQLASAPLAPKPLASTSAVPAPTQVPMHHTQSPTPNTLRPTPVPLREVSQPTPVAPAAPAPQTEPATTDIPAHPHHKAPKAPKSHIETAHAGLVGFVLFVVLAGLLVSPFIPGKTFDSFPGSSQSSSNGDQSLACLDTPSNVTSALTYNSRAGSPITYTYSTTTTQHATCDGKAQSAISGRTSQFNPLGLLIDILAALIVSIVIAKIWRKVFGSKD